MRTLEHGGQSQAVLKRLLKEDYYREFAPRLSRRQNIGFNSFLLLNRERSYVSSSNYIKPIAIKEIDIKAYYNENLNEPISYEFFRIFIQALDDAFMDFSNKQVEQHVQRMNSN